jgi:hypothetical protein
MQRREGYTDWEITKYKVTMTTQIDVMDQSYYAQIATFAHEFFVHEVKDLEYILEHFQNGSKSNLNIKNIIMDPVSDHKNYYNINSAEYSNMRKFLFYLKGYMGTDKTDKELDKAFNDDYNTNTENVSKPE